MEVIRDSLNPRVQLNNLPDDNRQILKNKASRSIWVLSAKFVEIVPDATSDIYEQGCIRAGVGTVQKPFLYRVETRVHPCRAALPITTHVVVELDAVGRVRL